MKFSNHLAALVLILTASGAGADFMADCNNGSDPARQIRGCTQVIERMMIS
jgi:hypothetical protein